ncbi:peptidoglycan D,D-transpeptidase FtsI family protein [Stenotrophomonas maltophilia]
MIVSFRMRYRIACGTLIVMALLLIFRAAYIQVIDSKFYVEAANAQIIQKRVINARRGSIYDRNGLLLAASAPVASLWIDPSEFKKDPAAAGALAGLVGQSAASINALVNKNTTKRFVYVPGMRRRNPELISSILEQSPKGVYSQREFKRFYPQSTVVSPVIGFSDINDEGVEGIEKMFNYRLKGKPGYSEVFRDRLGRPIELRHSGRPAVAGQDVHLSLDLRIQRVAQAELHKGIEQYGAKAGAVVILSAKDSEVLAMANWPSFNNNKLSPIDASGRRNRSVTDVFEPGSTVKPLTVAAGLTHGIIGINSKLDTNPGWISNGIFVTKDYRNLGLLSISDALNRSSNVGMSLISRELTKEQLRKMFSSFGAGRLSGSGFPGEQAGFLPLAAQWSDTTKQTMSYGYGLSMNALQLASIYGTIANDGVRATPSFEKASLVKSERVLSQTVAGQIKDILSKSTLPGGTSRRAAVEGYQVAGKTGTARKAFKGGYQQRYVSLFAGYVPAHNPRYAVAVVIDDPDPSSGRYGGGAVAAPIFSSIMTRVLWFDQSTPPM